MNSLLIPLALVASFETTQTQLEMREDAHLQYIENCDTGAYECTKEEIEEYEKRGYDSFECHADKHGEKEGFTSCFSN